MTDIGGYMSDVTLNGRLAGGSSPQPHLEEKPLLTGAVAFVLVLAAGLGFVAFGISSDIG
jgi:hypothetical protein